MKRKLTILFIILALFLATIACDVENEDSRMIEDAHQNTEQEVQP